MVGDALLVCYPWPWMSVEVLTAFVPVHRFLHGACGLLPEGHLPYVRSITACMRISQIEFVITVSDETGPCSRVYAVRYVAFRVCEAMSVLAIGAAVLAKLIQKVEAPKRKGWSLGSLPGWFSGAARPISQSDVRSMWWVTLEISLFWWVIPPLQPGVVGPLYGTECMASQPFVAGKSRSYPYPRAVIGIPWY
jgi:hypothetical protein